MKRAAAAVVLLISSVSLAAQKGINIPFETYTLPNGLTVVLSTDRSTPTVAVNLWYHVGSKNEMPGRTGFAHLFEHVMFTGSGHVQYGLHDRLTEGVGGMNNGTTSNDITTYIRDGAFELPRDLALPAVGRSRRGPGTVDAHTHES